MQYQVMLEELTRSEGGERVSLTRVLVVGGMECSVFLMVFSDCDVGGASGVPRAENSSLSTDIKKHEWAKVWR